MRLSWSLIHRLFLPFTCVVLLAFIAFRFLFIYYHHPSAAGVDNNVVYFIQRLLNGQSLYSNPAETPYAIAQYAPLYYYFTALLCKIAGLHADDVLQIFIISKYGCLLLNLLLCLTIYAIAKKIYRLSASRSWFIAFISLIFIEGNSFARPDSLEHLFFFVAFFFYLRGLKTSQALDFVSAGAVVSLAVFSKQSAITFVIFGSAWLLRNKDWRSLVFFISGGLVATIIMLLFIAGSSGIKNMYLNVVLGLDNGIYWGSFWVDIIVNFYSWYGCLWVMCFLFLFFLLRKEKEPVLRFLGFAMFLQVIITNLFALKYGSTSNYFTNWWIMIFLGAGIYWDRFLSVTNRVQPGLAILCLYFLLTLKTLLILQPAFRIYRTRDEKLAFYQQELVVAKRLFALNGNNKGFTVLCNLFSPDSFLNNILFREAVVPQYDVVTLASYPRHVFDYRNLINDLQRGGVTFVISNDNRTNFMDIPLTSYMLVEKIGPYSIFRQSLNPTVN